MHTKIKMLCIESKTEQSVAKAQNYIEVGDSEQKKLYWQGRHSTEKTTTWTPQNFVNGGSNWGGDTANLHNIERNTPNTTGSQ